MRVDRQQALELLRDAPLGELARRAHERRMEKHPDGRVTFVYDTNPNYTNVCEAGCRFCAFHRGSGAEEGAFTLSPDELAARVARASGAGATTVLLQGGHNPDLGLEHWLEYLRAIRRAAPGIHIHPFSPPEILYLSRREHRSVKDILAALRSEGVDTLPGGGAEVLVDRVRRLVSPKKFTAAEWLGVMEEAHSLGFRTTATLMFGHVETDGDIVDHLLAVREVQDRTGGFTSFIPWSFKPGGSPLGREVTVAAHPARYVRIIAVARLVLDNVDHVQSSWFSESARAGELGLLAGADDFGGLLAEEHVLRETGYERTATAAEVKEIIRRAGFVPARRDSYYRVVEEYPE